jgi:hypothetical protein
MQRRAANYGLYQGRVGQYGNALHCTALRWSSDKQEEISLAGHLVLKVHTHIRKRLGTVKHQDNAM